MYQIEIDHLCKSYGAVKVLKDISLNVEKGSFVALIGPSGCGKSTLLRLVAGLEKITSGTVKIAGQVVNDWPPRERHVAMVFQSYALYPHMTVAKNLTYALRLRGRPKQEIAERAAATGQLLGLSDLLDRMPRDLSGGQRQRVAMGRAIVRDPQVFLFDEPLSNLDAALRVRMRSELRKLHERLGATSVYVTHDQIEAMTMADTVVVLRDGVVEQVGAPLDLYHRPANRFVAGFIGSPAMNFIEGTVTEDGRSVVLVQSRKQQLELPRPLQSGRKVWIGLRPENMLLGGAGKQQSFSVQADTVESTGSMTFIETEADPTSLIIAQSGTAKVDAGTTITVGVNNEEIYLFDIQTDLAL